MKGMPVGHLLAGAARGLVMKRRGARHLSGGRRARRGLQRT
jgi:hypothetical protein